MIPNPNPIIASEFNKMWIQSLHILFPLEENQKGIIRAKFLPYDGGTNILAGRNIDISHLLPSNNEELNDVLNSIIIEIHRQASTNRRVRSININAPDPTKRVTAQIIFTEGLAHNIRDVFALTQTDITFAYVFDNTLNVIASLADL